MAWQVNFRLFSFMVCVMSVVCDVLDDECLIPYSEVDQSYCTDNDALYGGGSIRIYCSSNEVTMNYRGQSSVNLYEVTWICESGSTREKYLCRDAAVSAVLERSLSLNVTARGKPGSICFIEGCLADDTYHFFRIRSGNCVLQRGIENTTTVHTTAGLTSTTPMVNTTIITSLTGKDDDSYGMFIVAVIASVVGVLTVLILLISVIMMILYFFLQLQIRKYSHNCKVYGNKELPFDPHYTPVDIETPTFNVINRMSLLSMDNIFQSLHLDQAKGNLYCSTEQMVPTKALADVRGVEYHRCDSCVTFGALDKDDREDNEKDFAKVLKRSSSFTLSTVSDHFVSLGGISESRSSLQHESSVPCPPSDASYVHNLHLESALDLSLSNDHDFDYDCGLQQLKPDEMNFLSDLEYDSDSHENGDTVLPCGNKELQNLLTLQVGNDCTPHQQMNSVDVVPSLSYPFPTLFPVQEQAEANSHPILLDSHYVSSESGYIQSLGTQLNTKELECLLSESCENLDADLSVNQELKNEEELECLPACTMNQSQEFPMHQFCSDNTESNFLLSDCDSMSDKDSDEEADILVLDEPTHFCCRELDGYIADEHSSEVVPVPHILQGTSFTLYGDEHIQNNTDFHLVSGGAGSSSGYVTNQFISSGVNQQIY